MFENRDVLSAGHFVKSGLCLNGSRTLFEPSVGALSAENLEILPSVHECGHPRNGASNIKAFASLCLIVTTYKPSITSLIFQPGVSLGVRKVLWVARMTWALEVQHIHIIPILWTTGSHTWGAEDPQSPAPPNSHSAEAIITITKPLYQLWKCLANYFPLSFILKMIFKSKTNIQQY